MGSRARFAAAACLVVSGLLANGTCAPTAFAQPDAAASEDTGGSRGGDRTGTDRADDSDAVDDGGPGEEPGGDGAGDPSSAETEPKIPRGTAGDDLAGENPHPDGRATGEEEGDKGEDRPRPPCCDDREDGCHPGWPVPRPDHPDIPPVSDGDYDGSYGGGRPEGVPSLRPLPGGIMVPGREPPLAEPVDPGVLDVVPGIGIGATDTPHAAVSAPVVVTAPGATTSIGATAPVGVGAGAGPVAGGAAAAGLPAAPRQAGVEAPPLRQPPPAVGNSATAAPAYRVGYTEYLRGAGISQIAVLALPGLAGIVLLTGIGGLVGYRQARAGQGVRGRGTARFMN